MVRSQGWIPRLGPKARSQVWVPRLSLKVGFQCFNTLRAESQDWVPRLCIKVGYQGLVPGLGTNVGIMVGEPRLGLDGGSYADS